MRLLFITATRIGDAVLSTGALGHFLEDHPGLRVTVAVGAPAAPLFSALPGPARIITLRKQPRGAHWLSLWREVVATPWDIVVDLRASAIAYCLWAGKRYVAGRADPRRHRVAELGALLGLTTPPAPRIWTGPDHAAAARRLIPDGGPVIALGPAANWQGKQWPAEAFASLAATLTAPDGLFAGARVAVLAAAGERDQAAPLLAALPAERVIDLVGRVDLLTAAACLSRTGFFIGNDSGLMHLAAAVGTPTLGLFGPSRDERYRPWGPRAAVVRTPESYDELMGGQDFDAANCGSLMTGLSVETVIAAAAALKAKARP